MLHRRKNVLWLVSLFAAFSSYGATWLTIRLARSHRFGGDELSGVQKFHTQWVPRLGGVPIFIAIYSCLLLAAWRTNQYVGLTEGLLICMLPAFGIGLLEDITRRAGIKSRLIMTMVAAALGWWLIGAGIHHLDLPWIDDLLIGSSLFALFVTMVAAAGIAHAINIIDGYNGLSGFYAIIVLASLALIAFDVGDNFVVSVALISAATVAGFLIWNFPYGRIFMGDSGAYLLGFLMAELSMLLVTRNPSVSPWAPLLLMVYPVWETLFSMYRRSMKGLAHIGQPDALHLHQLIYRRLIKRYGASRDVHHRLMRNSLTSLYLWALAIMCAVPAVIFAKDPLPLKLFVLLFVVTYVTLYKRLVRFRAPRFMIVPHRPQVTAKSAARVTAEVETSDG